MTPPDGLDIEPQAVQVQQVAASVSAFLRSATFLNLCDRDEPRLLQPSRIRTRKLFGLAFADAKTLGPARALRSRQGCASRGGVPFGERSELTAHLPF